MKRALAAIAIFLPLCGCVAGIVGGAVGGAIVRGATGAGQPDYPDALAHGHGENPRWAVDVFETEMVFYSADRSITVETPLPIDTPEGHRFETERLTVDIAHAPCRPGEYAREYPDTVNVIADGTALYGCGDARELVEVNGEPADAGAEPEDGEG